MIFTSFAKALGQLPDPRFQRVLGLGIVSTIALLVAAYAGLLWLIEIFADGPVTLPGGVEITWLGDLLSWGSLGLMILLSIFLMVPVASAITSLFLDDVADAVEAKHYPHLSPVKRAGFWKGIKDTINFLGVLIAANILAFILYALLPLFVALNGFLLGREYFQIIALRRLDLPEAKALRKKHFWRIWAAGCLMALPLSLPLVNLIIPILGAATFTHLFHRLG